MHANTNLHPVRLDQNKYCLKENRCPPPPPPPLQTLTFDPFFSAVTLKIRPKPNYVFNMLAPMLYPCKFGSNVPTNSWEILHTRKFHANTEGDAIRIKNNISPPPHEGAKNQTLLSAKKEGHLLVLAKMLATF